MGTVSVLDPWWVTGLVDGEGSFTFNRNGQQMQVVFAIKMPACEQPTLERIRAFFGAGRIYEVATRTHDTGATKTTSYYRVTRQDELPKIVEHFNRYPLQSYKENAYQIWREMVALKREFRGRNREALEGLALQLSAAQPKNRN